MGRGVPTKKELKMGEGKSSCVIFGVGERGGICVVFVYLGGICFVFGWYLCIWVVFVWYLGGICVVFVWYLCGI